MRKAAIFLWAFVPAAVLAFHFGPGQDWLRSDRIAETIRDAERLAAEERWAEAAARYDEAIAQLGQEEADTIRRLRVARAKAWMFCARLPDAHRDLEALVDEIGRLAEPTPALEREARAALANAQYYMTWLLRLEGAPREEWEPTIEAARQNYRLLAEQAAVRADAAEETRMKEDLDSSVRLARMNLEDLQALPLPGQ
jgi:hypothetical protein